MFSRLFRRNNNQTSNPSAPVQQSPSNTAEDTIIEFPTPLPPRTFSKSTCFSASSNTSLLLAVSLTFFKPKPLELLGLLFNTLGFFLKQLHDYMDNNESRKKIRQQLIELEKLKNTAGITEQENTPSYRDRYGLEIDEGLVLSTIINTVLQLLVLGFTCWNIATNWNQDSDEAPVGKGIILAMTLAAYILDLIEQHFKKENLSRRGEKLAADIDTLRQRLT